jgi:hypothetical protein
MIPSLNSGIQDGSSRAYSSGKEFLYPFFSGSCIYPVEQYTSMGHALPPSSSNTSPPWIFTIISQHAGSIQKFRHPRKPACLKRL